MISEEHERRRLGTELHDGLGQLLAAAKMTAQQLAAEPLEDAEQEQALRLIELLGESIGEVRMLTSELAPAVLFELGLGAALLWLGDRYRQLYDLECTVLVDDEAAQLRGETAMFMFRVVREALNNVVRHSGATSAAVTIRREDAWDVVEVSDDGVGLDTSLVDDPGDAGGFGLFSIREECLGLGGTVAIASTRGLGTRITVRLPES